MLIRGETERERERKNEFRERFDIIRWNEKEMPMIIFEWEKKKRNDTITREIDVQYETNSEGAREYYRYHQTNGQDTKRN